MLHLAIWHLWHKSRVSREIGVFLTVNKNGAMEKTTEYFVPPAALNVALFGRKPMHYFDETYRIPTQWLKANVMRFHVTDQQIIDAAKHQFEGDPWNGDRWDVHPKVCGVYFLVSDRAIVYVGQSNHIARRIFQHRKNELKFDAIAWFEAPDFYIKDIEAYYIQRINPWLNINIPIDNEYARYANSIDGG